MEIIEVLLFAANIGLSVYMYSAFKRVNDLGMIYLGIFLNNAKIRIRKKC